MNPIKRIQELIEEPTKIRNYIDELLKYLITKAEIESEKKTKLRIALRPGNIWGTESGITMILNKDISIIIVSNMMGTSNRWDMEKLIIDTLDL